LVEVIEATAAVQVGVLLLRVLLRASFRFWKKNARRCKPIQHVSKSDVWYFWKVLV